MSDSAHNEPGGTGGDEPNGTGRDERIPRQFERNRYFNGKLMTARDMQAEQEYHRTRLDTLTRHVTGTGIVCGLGVEIEPRGTADETPRAIVGSGIAIDAEGRQIVVTERTPKEIPGDKLTGDGVSVFIEQTTCKTESVPATGSEDACKEECDYNRLRETFEISFEVGPPGSSDPQDEQAQQKPVRVDRVSFPSRSMLGDDGTGDESADTETAESGPTDDALHDVAQSYHRQQEADSGTGGFRDCGPTGHERVFLGHFRNQDGSWESTAEAGADDSDSGEPRPYVYTNDMLYAGLLEHATDFENPHEVAMTVLGGNDVDALVSIESLDDAEEAVELHSPAGTIQITPKPDRRVEFELAGELRERLDALEELDPEALESLIDRTEELDSLLDRSEDLDALLDQLEELESVPDRLDDIEDRLDSIEATLARFTGIEDSITDVVDVRDQLVSLADNRDQLVTIAGQQDLLASLTENRDQLVALAENRDQLVTLAGREPSITALADNESQLTSLASNGDSLINLASNETQLTTLASNESQLITLASNESQLTTLANNESSLLTLANNETQLTTLADNQSTIFENIDFDPTS